MAVSQFYGSDLGNRLIDPRRFPDGIKLFLSEEERLLDSMSSSFDLLVEIGCMHGRYLNWAVARKTAYLGVDIVQSYVDEGQENVRQLGLDQTKYRFARCGAENIETITTPAKLRVDASRVLLFFPFNSIGNIARLEPVILALKMANSPFLISTYGTDDEATRVPSVYYAKCGYEALECCKESRGIRFRSPLGFCSIAYHPAYVADAFRKHGITVDAVVFAEIGIGYKNRNSVTQ